MNPGDREPAAVLEGCVLDAAGVAVPGALVLVLEEAPRESLEPHLLASEPCDGRGRFRIEVSPGPCLVRAFRKADTPGREFQSASDPSSVRVSPAPGETVPGIQVHLPYAMASLVGLRGTVLDVEGRAIVDLQVELEVATVDFGTSSILVLTDAGGRFEFRDHLPGARTFVIRATRRFLGLRREIRLPLEGGQDLEVRLEERPRPGTRSLLLRCEDESGRGVEGVRISIVAGSGFLESFVTGIDGEVVADRLPDELAGTHVWVHAFHGNRWTSGESWHGAETPWPERVVLRLEPPEDPPGKGVVPRIWAGVPRWAGGTLRVRVVDASGAPAKGARVYWIPAGAGQDLRSWDLLAEDIGSTDAEGRLSRGGVTPGPALLVAAWDAVTILDSAEGFPSQVVQVDLVEGRTEPEVEIRLDITLADLGIVACRVEDEDGHPRSGAMVSFQAGDPPHSSSLTRFTDEEGRAEFRVPPGPGQVSTRGSVTHEEASVRVELPPGRRWEAVLRPPARRPKGTASVTVRVVDEAGEPVAGAAVHLTATEGNVGEGFSGADGVCRFTGLADEVRGWELHASAHSPAFKNGTPGTDLREWPSAGPAEATVILRRAEVIRVLPVEKGTSNPILDCRLEVRDGCSGHGMSSVGLPWPEFFGISVLPGRVRLRAHSSGYRIAEMTIEVLPGMEDRRFEIPMERLP